MLDGSALTWDVNDPNGSAFILPWSAAALQIDRWEIASDFDGDLAEVYVNHQPAIGTDSTTMGWFRNGFGLARNLGFSDPRHGACWIMHSGGSINTPAEVFMRVSPPHFLLQLGALNSLIQEWDVPSGFLKYLGPGEQDPCARTNDYTLGCRDITVIP